MEIVKYIPKLCTYLVAWILYWNIVLKIVQTIFEFTLFGWKAYFEVKNVQ